MPLLGMIRCGSTLLLVLFLANLATRSDAQAALDFMDMEGTTLDPLQNTAVQCKGDCEKQTKQAQADIPIQSHPGIPITDFCSSPPDVTFAELKDDFLMQTVFTKGAIVSYKCKNGYEYVPGTKETAMCMGDGKWSSPDTFCRANFCGLPPQLQYGQPKEEYLETTIFPKDSKITYICRLGYVRIPYVRAAATCMPDFTWSLPATFCKRKSCGNPGDLDNGEMHTENFDFGSRVTYSCNPGFKMISRRNYRDCQADGKWSNNVPECAVQSCLPPPNTANGHYYPEKEEYTYLDSVKYICSGNLALIGEQTISCTEEGQWSSKPPECKAVRCPDPNVDNASKISGFMGPYNLNSVVRFTCRPQYKMIGSDTVKCNESSKWEPEFPKCVGTCRSVPPFQYAELEEPTTELIFLEGTTLKYRCKEGYEPVPGAVNTVTCLRLRWSSPPEFCKPIRCVEPENVPHGRIISGLFLYGSRITYTCEIGYKIKNNYRKCLSDRSWSLPIPECEVETCAAPEYVQYGWYRPVMDEYLYNDTVTYNCHEGFQLVGQAAITCRSDGRWNYRTPECKGICNAPPDLPYAQLQFQYQIKKTFFARTTVQYICRPRYYRDYSFTNSVTCLGNFTWSKISNEFCKVHTCSTPGNVKNGWYGPEMEKYLYNDTVTYECFEGFQLVGQASATCLHNGRWNYNTPECKGISCGNPPEVRNAAFEAKDFLFESEAIYKCEKGYKMVSQSNSVKCGSNGRWEGAMPVCEVQKCLPPEDLKDGSYSLKKDEYTYNESVTYKCDTLQLVGKASVTCTEEGKWSSGAPQCRAVCIFPPELDFAVVEEEFIHQEFFDNGTSVQYKCRPGFVPVTGKNNNLTCLSDLKWSQHELFCTLLSCGNPGPIDHGQVQGENFFFGSRVNYTCNPRYLMISKINYRECQADGTWSGIPPVCKEPVCDKIWELQEEARKCTSTPDEWIKYLQVQHLYLQIENLKLDIELKKRQLGAAPETSPICPNSSAK